jgi:hypothetical protein
VKNKILLVIAIIVAMAIPALADPVLGSFKVYQVTCNGTAAKMGPSNYSKQIVSFRWWVNSATPVFVGGSDVNTTDKGFPYCTDTASCALATDTADGPPSELWCRTAGSSVIVTIFGGPR